MQYRKYSHSHADHEAQMQFTDDKKTDHVFISEDIYNLLIHNNNNTI